jgi:tyrosyl-tRNA synthetase
LPQSEMSVLDILKAAFSISGGEARRMAQQGAVSLNDEKVEDATLVVVVQDGAVLRMGKRRWARLKVSS